MTKYSQAKPAGTPTWVDLSTPDAEAARAHFIGQFLVGIMMWLGRSLAATPPRA